AIPLARRRSNGAHGNCRRAHAPPSWRDGRGRRRRRRRRGRGRGRGSIARSADSPIIAQGLSQRAVSLRQRQKIQELLRQNSVSVEALVPSACWSDSAFDTNAATTSGEIK